MEHIEESVTKLVQPIVEENGCYLVDVCYEKKHASAVLTVFIDKEGGVTLNDCEKVHMAIDEPLDALNPTNDQPYTLNVSSPGLDRPFKKEQDFQRSLGKQVEVHLYKQVQKKKLLVGTLISFTPESITILVNNKEMVIEKTIISKVTNYIEF